MGSKRTPDGYGQFRGPTGRVVTTHRFSYEHFKGPIPDGMLICHHCDTPQCVNPEHLFTGSSTENARDMVAKGRDNYGGKKRTPLRLKRYGKGDYRNKAKTHTATGTITKCGRFLDGSVKLAIKEAPTCNDCAGTRKERSDKGIPRHTLAGSAGVNVTNKEGDRK
jgi:hypothetical protein